MQDTKSIHITGTIFYKWACHITIKIIANVTTLIFRGG